MGGSSSSSGGTQPVDMTTTTTLGEKSPEQAALESRLGSLNTQQTAVLRNAIQRMRETGATGLTPEDQEQLAMAFSQAKGTFDQRGAEMTRFLQGGRGHALSNTPMSPQAMARLNLGRADLLGLEADAMLNYGQQAQNTRNRILSSLTSSNPGAGVASLGLYGADRYGNRTTRTYGTGGSFMNGSSSNTNANIQTGMQLAGGIGALADRGMQLYRAWNAPPPTTTPTITDATGSSSLNLA